MTKAVEDTIKAWAAPALLTLLMGIGGYLWLDMRQTVKDLTVKIGNLNDAVVRLTTLQEEQARR